MTPQESLKILNEVAQKYLGTRKDHELLSEAYNVLYSLINEPKDAKENAI